MDENRNFIDEIFLEAEVISECRKAAHYLLEENLISNEEYDRIDKKMADKRGYPGFLYVTQPFKTCDTIGISLYNLMKSIQRNCKVK